MTFTFLEGLAAKGSLSKEQGRKVVLYCNILYSFQSPLPEPQLHQKNTKSAYILILSPI